MIDQTYKYRAGTILLLEEGEYSDFGYAGQVVTLQELDLRQAIDECKAAHVAKDEYDTPDASHFVAWLCATQRCAALECQTAHIGSYGSLDL